MLKNLENLWNLPRQLDQISFQLGCLGKHLYQTNSLTEECLRDFQQFMAIARRLDEANPDRRAESDRIGAAAIAKMLAEDAVRRKQEGRS